MQRERGQMNEIEKQINEEFPEQLRKRKSDVECSTRVGYAKEVCDVITTNKNDTAAPRSSGGGATLMTKPTPILAENALATIADTQEEDPGRKPYVLENHGYTLGCTIGSGSYATVKVARSERHECDVAVKIVSKFQAPALYLNKFLPREIEVVKGLKNQNLIRFLQAIETTHR
uniref:Protein kinase domain-containing protein n=1 Tax=Timema bartmani TaxID=61472 RepID=A0A7R9I5U8_9NEOP|nr:unnamed protein product [Timema bartmani]